MPWWGDVLVSAGAALLATWVLLVLLLWRSGRGTAGLTEAARLLPDLLRLVSRLARDRALPRRVRLLLWFLLGYLVSPLDLVPDVIPVVGYADDAVVVAIALRAVVRSAGSGALDRHWPGTPDGLAVVRRLAGVAA